MKGDANKAFNISLPLSLSPPILPPLPLPLSSPPPPPPPVVSFGSSFNTLIPPGVAQRPVNMGYGSSSKGGGGSSNPGGSKKTIGGGKHNGGKTHKKKEKKQKYAEGDELATLEPEQLGHILILPDAEQRGKLLEQRRSGEEHLAAARAARPVNGTNGGETLGDLGGSSTHDTTSSAAPQAEPQSQREARLLYFAKQDAELAQASRKLRDERDAPYASQQQLTRTRLDALAARFESEQNMSSSDSSSTEDPAAICLRLLSTVLRNGATKMGSKFRRLPARNDRLWSGLLQHPEAVDILTGAGFVRQRPLPAPTSVAAAATADEIERDKIKLQITQQLDTAIDADHIASLVAELERLSAACARPPPPPQPSNPAREFDYVHLCSDVTAKDDATIKQLGPLLATLQAVNAWKGGQK